VLVAVVTAVQNVPKALHDIRSLAGLEHKEQDVRVDSL
jgi:hypothetical protein